MHTVYNLQETVNLCCCYLLLQSFFQSFCKSAELVCGQNGETYSSVCAAYSDRVAVDYYGACQAVGPIADYSFQRECVSVQCPLPTIGYKPVIPPGENTIVSTQ